MYSFEGKYKSKPEQSLRGASKKVITVSFCCLILSTFCLFHFVQQELSFLLFYSPLLAFYQLLKDQLIQKAAQDRKLRQVSMFIVFIIIPIIAFFILIQGIKISNQSSNYHSILCSKLFNSKIFGEYLSCFY